MLQPKQCGRSLANLCRRTCQNATGRISDFDCKPAATMQHGWSSQQGHPNASTRKSVYSAN